MRREYAIKRHETGKAAVDWAGRAPDGTENIKEIVIVKTAAGGRCLLLIGDAQAAVYQCAGFHHPGGRWGPPRLAYGTDTGLPLPRPHRSQFRPVLRPNRGHFRHTGPPDTTSWINPRPAVSILLDTEVVLGHIQMPVHGVSGERR